MKSIHIHTVSRTPALACAPPPSTTAFLPCLLTILGDAFGAIFTGIAAFTPVLTSFTGVATDFLTTIPLAIRSLPWKVGGPLF